MHITKWFTGSQRVGHDWATELNWTEVKDHSGHGKNIQKILQIQNSKDLATIEILE